MLCFLIPARDSISRGEERIVVRPRLDSTGHAPGVFWYHRPVKRPRIGLVLSGGGARGASQIGVLKVLEKHHIPVDFIAASSMGSLVGGLYASGYSPGEIEQIALTTNWDEVLALTEETKRTDLFIDQKLVGDRNFLAVRFQGLEPVLPSAFSSGQRFTDFLSTQTLQSLYHPYRSFDDLKIPFRAVATDLISGTRVVLRDGSLAEALRASATVPLLFNPVEKGGMKLIDGGLVDNIPADIAREAGCDIVIVVNSTSSLRRADEMSAPWQTADQIMGIMMQAANEEQLKKADLVITPAVGRHLSTNFNGLDSLIAQGESACEANIQAILGLFRAKFDSLDGVTGNAGKRMFENPQLERTGTGIPDSLWNELTEKSAGGSISLDAIRKMVNQCYETGEMDGVYAEVIADSATTRIRFFANPNPTVTAVRCEGSKLVVALELEKLFTKILGMPFNQQRIVPVLENVLRVYRSRGFSLARIDSTDFDPGSGQLRLMINEGVIGRIEVQGGIRTEDSFVLREFPLEVGEVFQIEKAKRGITNINAATLFDYVYLEVTYPSHQPVLTIRLKERPSQLVRLGLRADNERFLQGSLDIRDENFQGTGSDLGLTLSGGQRNGDVVLEYKARRLFDTYLTFSLSGFYHSLDSYAYGDAPGVSENHWARTRIGEYQDIRYGASLSFGGQLERLGNAAIELVIENVQLKNIENLAALEERYQFGIIRLGTQIDTKDRYPFPSKGIGLNLSYEFALEPLGSDIGYNDLKLTYETYTTWGRRHTFHPKFTMGFADRTMPLSQQFRLGGLDSFFGSREDDRRGRQLLLVNMEYRYLLPFRIIFESYLRARYDLGTISAVPEEIKFSTFRHAIGVELALETPVGPAVFGVGESFYFSKNLPQNPVQEGPFLFYFSIGYQL